jgi:hypothetical protein
MAIVPLTAREPHRLRQAYASFWDSIAPLTGGRAQQATIRSLDATLDLEGRVSISTREAFAIVGVPARRTVQQRSAYDVYLTVRQVVEGHAVDAGGEVGWWIIASNIKLIYLDARTRSQVREEREETLDKAKVHQGLHLDLSDEANHPVFHAQVDHACISEDFIGRRYVADARRCDVPRIPTAPLDFPGVVYVLLHDHFPDAVRKGWPPKIRDAVRALPRMPMTAFSTILAAGAHMDCACWYSLHHC